MYLCERIKSSTRMIRKYLFIVALLFALLSAKADDTQELWEIVPQGGSIVSGDVYLIANSDCDLAMGAVSGTNSKAASLDFKTNSAGTIGMMEYENSEDYPYEITFTLEDNGYYSLKSEQGYICFHVQNYFEIKERLLTSGVGYWSCNLAYTHPKIISKYDDDYMIDTGTTDGETTFGTYKETSSSIYLFHKMTDAGISVEITSAGYATLYYSDKNLVVPDGVTAYTIKYEDSSLAVARTYASLSVIPAGTAVVIGGSAGTYTFHVADTTGTASTKNILEGTDEETEIENDNDYYYYMLSLDAGSSEGSVGFYWGAEGGAAFTNKAHKAYFKLSKTEVDDAEESSSSAGAFPMSELGNIDEVSSGEDYDGESDMSLGSDTSSEDETTDVVSLTKAVTDARDKGCYTLGGVKVAEPTAAGLYIIDGRKQAIK